MILCTGVPAPLKNTTSSSYQTPLPLMSMSPNFSLSIFWFYKYFRFYLVYVLCKNRTKKSHPLFPSNTLWKLRSYPVSNWRVSKKNKKQKKNKASIWHNSVNTLECDFRANILSFRSSRSTFDTLISLVLIFFLMHFGLFSSFLVHFLKK